MASAPVICFGQQPCGFFPRRFLVAKVRTARRVQAEIGGEIVFFCHDSDHDPRETRTILRHRKTGLPAQLNFSFENRLQRKFSPLYLKRIRHEEILRIPTDVARLDEILSGDGSLRLVAAGDEEHRHAASPRKEIGRAHV